MTLPAPLTRFARNEDGTILVFWGVALVVVMGLLALTFDIGSKAATQTELQSFADNVALAAAGELDGRPDALTRATRAAQELITDSQTFGSGSQTLSGSQDVTLTFFSALADDGGTVDVVATRPENAYYVRATAQPKSIGLGFGAAFAALRGDAPDNRAVSASATANFELEACDAAPIQVCLPTIDFRAEANIGNTLDLKAAAGVGLAAPGVYALTKPLTDRLDGLSVCAGLLGKFLNACLVAANDARSGCYGGSEFEIATNLTLGDTDAALNARLGQFSGITAGLAGNANFSPAPNVLQGLVSVAGLCLPNNILPTPENIGLPTDDCLAAGTCSVLGNGSWAQGRIAYVNKHYRGVDPYPEARTRYEFYQAEIANQNVTPLPVVGGLLGGVVGSVAPRLCSPQSSKDTTRRVMVVAGIDCSGAASAGAGTPPVRQFFEVFQLGPSKNGLLSVEIVACLGGTCGQGETETVVRDIVRLVR